ncbi:sensor histidine kinase [Nocardioides bruguierae]|uniref:sensor histidine kinase n=1 Tax=Nocardioides bruguierae TaxID=2945102 RepID=UPI0020214678|nr:HAMP domain-containing sensor histidine kinase [Nocardioides bruguierae]MCL8026115.1 HAMP domain-containing histidine kinase [Nocardioides bruguierae]
MSLRARIILLVVGTTLVVLTLAGVPLALVLQGSAQSAAEARATDAADGVAGYLTSGSVDVDRLADYLDRVNAGSDYPVTVRLADDTLVGADLDDDVALALGPDWDGDGDGDDKRDSSSSTPSASSSASTPASTPGSDRDDERDSASARPDGDGDADSSPGVESTSIVSTDEVTAVELICRTDGAGELRVVAVVDDDHLSTVLRWRYLVGSAVALALVLLAWLAAEVTSRRLVRPLQRTAATAVALSGGDLAARAPVSGPPEVAHVAVELNALAARIDELLTAEREQAADLSHRLRTPVMAVRLGVETLPASPERAELESAVDALERSLTRIIRAARRGNTEGLHPSVDAVAVARERVEFWAPLAEDQGRALTLDLPDAAFEVRSTPDDLGSALDALLENVLAHTPEGTAFAVRVAAQGSATTIEVTDDGSGIAPDALRRGLSDRGSSGLGLDIARGAAEASGGWLELIDPGPDGRARGVRLTFGPARP